MTKNKNPKISFFFLFALIITACNQQPKSPIELNQKNPTTKKQAYYLTSQGDSIPTGVPIPIKGRTIDLTLPKTFPHTFTPKIESANSNIHAVGKPKIVSIPKKLTVKTPGKEGVSLPKIIHGEGDILPVMATKSERAFAPKMKERATSNIQYWGIEEGLTYSTIRSLLEDRRGHLWIGTRDYGVSRFDGQYFKHYTQQAGITIAPLDMVEDKKGNIWMGSRGGLTMNNGITFTHFQQKDGLSDTYIRCLLADSKDNIWMGTQANGLSHFQPNEKGLGGSFTQYTTDTGLSHRRVNTVMEDKKGNIWVGTTNGLNRFDGKQFTHYTTKEGLSNNEIFFILEDKNEHLWIGTGNGLNRFDGQSFYQYTTEQGLTGNFIWTLYEDRQGHLWVGTFDGGGLMRFNPDKSGHIKNYKHYSTAMGLSENFINRILEDSANNIWIGTSAYGINRLNESYITHYPIGPFINSIAADKKGHLWFGSDEVGIIHFDGANWHYFGVSEGEPIGPQQGLLVDKQDNLWFRKWQQGVFKFQSDESNINGQLTKFSQEGGLTRSNNDILEDSRGNFWFANFHGITLFDGEKFITYGPSEGLPSNVALGLFEDQQQNIWIMMGEHGVSRFTPNADGTAGHFTHFTTAEGLSSHYVNDIFEDSRGNLWFGTNGGLNYFDGQRFIPLTIKDGLSHNVVNSIMEDNQQNIWVGTYIGINLLKPKLDQPDSIQSSLLEKYSIHQLGKEDGLYDLRFMKGSVHLDNNNQLWWGHYRGVTKLNLNKFKFSDTPPKVRLNTIELANNFVDFRRLKNVEYQQDFSFGSALSQSFDSVAVFENYPLNLNLPYDLNHLTFRFSGIDWTAPHKIQYSYKMEGLDKAWSAPKKEPIADYRNLPYGNYTFKIRAKGEAQIWSELFDYPFTIHPPWWHTWWARMLYMLLGGALMYSLFQWRTVNLRKQQKQLEATVTRRTAEVVEQQKRSDELLLNILPAEVATELKTTGQVQPVLFEEVSILFADFQEFTNIVASIPGKKLVQELDDIFQHFDDIMETQGIEKIQTIGDAYVAACGLPQKTNDHAVKCVQAAQQMIAYLDKRNRTSAIKWKIRIGIHSGAITAGVVGKRKFTYDLFGDTINIAARIESSGEEGKINVSAYTYDLIKAQFPCDYRGKINAKGKGNLDMYFVE